MRSDLLPSTVDLLKKIWLGLSTLQGVVSNASYINPVTKKAFLYCKVRSQRLIAEDGVSLLNL